MALVVFLRAVNVAGRTLRARALADALGLVNVGAAGTFVAPDGGDAGALERAIRRRLPFETQVIVRPAREVLGLLRGEPFGAVAPEDGVARFVSVLEAPPRRPRLPVEAPEGRGWEVRVVRVVGPFALSLRRRRGPRAAYPNAVVEKAFGVAATTRGWDTMLAIGRVLEEARGEAPHSGRQGRHRGIHRGTAARKRSYSSPKVRRSAGSS